jgi:protein-tyrosine phosphatase
MQKILFVCTGNICRSPTAEAVFRDKAKKLGLEKKFIFDSAGTDSYHVGEFPDARSTMVGKSRGISFDGIFARKISAKDFDEFDFLMAMDKSHYDKMMRVVSKENQKKIKLFLQFCEVKNLWNDEVIDPYYKSGGAFEDVFDAIDESCGKFV